MITDPSNETGVCDATPDVARALLTKAFPAAGAKGLRVINGRIERKDKGGAS